MNLNDSDDITYDSDASLVSGVLAGDTQALESYVVITSSILIPLAKSYLPESIDYEQVALDISTDIISSLSRFDEDKASLRTYVRYIGQRRIVDVYRAEAARRNREEGEKTKFDLAHKQKVHPKMRLSEEQRIQLLAELNKLSKDEHELLRLFFEEKLPDSEVSSRMSITRGSARKRKQRIVKRLSEELNKITA